MESIIIKNNILSKEELKDLLKRYHQERRINKPLLLISEERINYLDIFKREFSNLTVYNNNIKIEEFDYIFDFLGSSKYLDKETITRLNRLDRTVSIDINTSLSNINGLGTDILKSRETIVYQTYQPGHFLNMAKDYIGKLILYKNKDTLSNTNLLEITDIKEYFPERLNFSNKGSYGKSYLIGGSISYSGAIKLANLSLSSLLAGSGRATLVVDRKLTDIVAPYLLESTLMCLDNIEQVDTIISNSTAILFGPGLDISEWNKKILDYLLINSKKPLVIDASGLVMIDKPLLLNKKCEVVLTPHPKEFARLIDKSVEEVLENPMELAVSFAKKNKVILLLKGTTTIVTDGDNTYFVNEGHAGMATSGSGDVLSGILTGLISYNKVSPKLVAAASFLAGYSASLALETTNDISYIARDTIKFIPQAISDIRKS